MARQRIDRDDDSDDDLPAVPRRRAGVPVWVLLVTAALCLVVGGGVGVVAGSALSKVANAARQQQATKAAAAEGANNPPLKTTQAAYKKDPFTVRLVCKLDDYYNFNFMRARESHYSIAGEEQGTGTTIHVYARKDSEVGKALFRLLSAGEEHQVEMELVFGESPSVASVNRILSTR